MISLYSYCSLYAVYLCLSVVHHSVLMEGDLITAGTERDVQGFEVTARTETRSTAEFLSLFFFLHLFRVLIRLLSSFYQLHLLITVENINLMLMVSIYSIRLLEQRGWGFSKRKIGLGKWNGPVGKATVTVVLYRFVLFC